MAFDACSRAQIDADCTQEAKFQPGKQQRSQSSVASALGLARLVCLPEGRCPTRRDGDVTDRQCGACLSALAKNGSSEKGYV